MIKDICFDKYGRLVIPDARIFSRNFAGRQTERNRDGNRTFCVFIDDPKIIEELRADKWNVRFLDPRKDGDETKYYIPVAVSYKKKPPEVFVHTRKKITPLEEDTIESLDYAEIKFCNLIINPSRWDVNGKTGTKAYLNIMHVYLEEDYFAEEEYPGELPFN